MCLACAGWSTGSVTQLPQIKSAIAAVKAKEVPNSKRGLPFLERTPVPAKRFSVDKGLELRRQSFAKKR